MANLKPKTPRLISINGETATGGAPIFADDIVRVQENDQADIINYMEANRRLLPELLTWDGATQSKQFENGLILSGLEYDNTNPALVVVSEGYILSGGEVCYYPGGNIATGLTNRGLLYLYKGAANNTARVFNVGGSKDILVTYDIVIEQSSVTANGLELDGATAITPTDEVVVLGIGIPGAFNGEDYFTFRTSQGVTELGGRITESPWVAATLADGVGIDLPYLVSRVNNDGTTEVRGSIKVLAGSQGAANIVIGTLNSHNINSAGSIYLSSARGSNNLYYALIVNAAGDLRLSEPVAGWPVIDIDIVVNDVVLGVTTLPTPYEYKKDFLDIT